jgi:hypothetical protein
MRALTGELLLTAWDQGAGKSALARGLLLLSLALPEADRQQLAQLSIADRNLRLLRLRELTFGPVLQGFGVCSQCSAQLEFAVPAGELIEHVQQQICETPVTWSENGKQHQLRAVTSADLLATLDAPSEKDGEERLLARCLSVSSGSVEAEASTESPGDRPTILEKFNQLNAAAELNCAVTCAVCSSPQTLDLDIAQFLWLEVRSAAKRLLAEIHELAWAYGWSERSLLRMSPARRHAYMEMLSG